MAEPGLTSRLRQHSRRSGMMVGLSMALSIAIVIVAFIWIYIRLSPFVSDFVPSNSSASVKGGLASPIALVGTPTAQAQATRSSLTGGAASTAATPTPSPTAVWQATHTIRPDRPDINFRAGPSTLADVVTVLRPGTELKFLGEQQAASGVTWMKFETKDGKVGWVRNVDIVSTSGANP